ncbi:MAG TPA: universal stress protein [Nitrospiraceae bacterium]|nr:universal stress protein [Nitrospiraceae bacterium]
MNVLVATDGSEYGRWELNWVAELPFVEPPRVTALHVLDLRAIRAPRGPFLSQAGSERYLQKELLRMETRSAKTIKKAKQQLVLLKLKGMARKEQGDIAPTILKRAPKRDGLLVVGSKGLDALDRFMLGSVSTKLIHHATCPVLVVKNEATPVGQIALAIDGSDASANALEFVRTKFQPDRSTGKGGRVSIHVRVIHVMPFSNYQELKEARKLLEQGVRKLIQAGFTAEAVCLRGRPAEEIMKITSKHHADLIVMGAKGLGAIARFLLGSVSTRVVQHATCSVLVVR